MSQRQARLASDDDAFIVHSIQSNKLNSTDLEPPKIYIVDDEYFSRLSAKIALENEGLFVEEYSTCEDFLSAYKPRTEACLILDLHFPDMSGLELLERLRRLKHALPTIVMSGSSEISEAVQSMKSGAMDFIVKPIEQGSLLECVQRALGQSREGSAIDTIHGAAVDHLRSLTPRQRQIMDLVLAGQPSKNIAADLGISQRTVENHRAAIMRKTGSKSLAALARLAIIAFDAPVSLLPFAGTPV